MQCHQKELSLLLLLALQVAAAAGARWYRVSAPHKPWAAAAAHLHATWGTSWRWLLLE
jgi:hypothetical protein